VNLCLACIYVVLERRIVCCLWDKQQASLAENLSNDWWNSSDRIRSVSAGRRLGGRGTLFSCEVTIESMRKEIILRVSTIQN